MPIWGYQEDKAIFHKISGKSVAKLPWETLISTNTDNIGYEYKCSIVSPVKSFKTISPLEDTISHAWFSIWRIASFSFLILLALFLIHYLIWIHTTTNINKNYWKVAQHVITNVLHFINITNYVNYIWF